MPDHSDTLDVYLEIAEVIILVLDCDGRIRRINRKGVEVLGYRTADELEGRDWFEVAVPRELRKQMHTVFNAVLSGDGEWPQQYENEVVAASGEKRIIEWRNTMLRNAQGQITGTLSSGTDITERLAIERELRRAEHRQRYLLDLGERLRNAPSARQAVRAACQALGEELGAMFVGVGELQADDEYTVVESEWRRTGAVPSTLGRHHQPAAGADRFGAMLRGEVVAIQDVGEDPRTADPIAQGTYAAFGARASLDVPLQRAGRVRALMFVADDQPRDWSAEDIAIAQETLDRAWHAAERARAEATLAGSEARLQAILDALPIGVVLGEAPSGKITFANRAIATILCHPPLASPDRESYREWESYHADGRRVEAEEYPLAQVLRTGKPADGSFHYRRGDGAMSWVRITGAPIHDEQGKLVAGVVGVIDIDEQVKLIEHQRVLVAELSHRVKNILAVIQAIAQQSLKGAKTLESFSSTFEGRLQALSIAHSLLVKGNWSTISLSDLVHIVLAPFSGRAGAIGIAGPDVALSARQGIALSLILHELATNAVKYGALSDAAGQLEVQWSIRQPFDGVELRWCETGLLVTPIVGPDGFGTRLIRRSVSNDLRGSAERQTGTGMLAWTFKFPR